MSANTEWAAIVRKLQSKLTKVTKQRDGLVEAIKKHKVALPFTLGDCDELLHETLEEVMEEGKHE